MNKTDKIILLGLLSDETYIKRFQLVRGVYYTQGIAPTITAGCGMGGGVTPKILEADESE